MIAIAAASTAALVVGFASLTQSTEGSGPVGDVPLPVAASGSGDERSEDGRSVGERGDGDVPIAARTDRPPPAPVQDAVGARSARLEDLPAPAAPPVRVQLEDLGIDAAVVEMGVEEGGAVAVPDDVSVAGWYRFGPVPGQDGSAVITAHVDSAAQGAGAFFPLRDAAPGAEVVITSADGAVRRFEVVGRRSYRKAELPVEALFARVGEPVLTLITCGGAFDAASRSYEENVVVYATPVDGPTPPA